MYFSNWDTDYKSCMASWEPRMALLCLLCISNHALFVIEQPRQSLLYNYFRWQWLENRVCWVPCVHPDLHDHMCMHACIIYFLAPCCTSGVSSGLLVDEIWIPITEEVVVTQQLGYHYSNGFGASYTHTSSCSNHCQNFLPWPQHAVMHIMHACMFHA